jgi:hypothetical protein
MITRMTFSAVASAAALAASLCTGHAAGLPTEVQIEAGSLAVSGHTAFLPTEVQTEAGSLAMGGHVGGVVRAVAATEAYVLWGQGAELVVATPDGAVRWGGLMLDHVVEDLFISGGRVYAAAGVGGLYVVDLAVPSAPTLIAHIPLPAIDPEDPTGPRAISVVVAAGYAYVALGESGLWTVDLDEPDQVTLSGPPQHHLALAGAHLLALDNAAANSGYQVWDLAAPIEPRLLGSVEVGQDVADLAVSGDRLYLANRTQGLQIRAWDPEAPLTAGLLGALDLEPLVSHVALVPGTARALLATGAGLAEVRIEDPAAPALAALAPGIAAGPMASNNGRAGRAFVAGGQAALQVLRWTAAGLTFERELGLRGSSLAGALHDGALYLAQDQQGLTRLSLADPAHPVPEARVDTGFWAQALAHSAGNTLVLAEGAQVLAIAPGSLEVLGRAALPNGEYARAVVTAGETAYVAASGAGVCAVGLADPARPVLLSCADTEGEALDVALAGSTLYVADSANGVVVVDAADPAALRPLGRYPEAYAYALAVVGDELYVSDVSGGGRLLRLARGADGGLAYAGEFDTAGFVRDVALDGRLVYLANEEGLQVLEREADGSLSAWAAYDSAGGAAGVIVNGSVVYLLDTVNGLVVLAPSTPPDEGRSFTVFLAGVGG